ncbi:bifunctional arginine demethylase and lysyl-hydroxylase PSR-like protein [Phlyctochytrium arcticum]|nr:bifunctional arginine demethylase and lysyl-hydroxylase PSR-like protein [Phlyctochytrium arcticum]
MGRQERKLELDLEVKPRRYARRLKSVKRAGRSELDDFGWTKDGHAARSVWPNHVTEVERISYRDVSEKEFIQRFEKPSLPVIIQDGTAHWRASRTWTPQALLARHKNEKFKVGEDDDGSPVNMQLKYYLYYALVDPNGASKDDSPLYIFDSKFGDRKENNTAWSEKKRAKRRKKIEKYRERRGTKRPSSLAPARLLEDFEVPKYFRDDFFQICGEKQRPPYRWLVAGPARSGTGIHTDPLGTSAWNALLWGHKRWVLFPPTTPKKMIDPKLSDYEAITWFAQVYPTLQRAGANGISLAESLGMMEFQQGPGEIVFIPGGWHHIVINCDFTIAITQNFCSKTNFEEVWLATRFSRPRLAKRFEGRLTLLAKTRAVYRQLLTQIQQLKSVPAIEPDSTSSDSSSSSSSDSDDSSHEDHGW